MESVILVGIGGAIGSVLRFEFSKLAPFHGIPAGTLAVNIIGSFVFGIIVFLHAPGDILYYLAGIGGPGGFTTFTPFSYETFRMLENHDYYTMGENIVLNGAGSLAGVPLAFLLVPG